MGGPCPSRSSRRPRPSGTPGARLEGDSARRAGPGPSVMGIAVRCGSPRVGVRAASDPRGAGTWFSERPRSVSHGHGWAGHSGVQQRHSYALLVPATVLRRPPARGGTRPCDARNAGLRAAASPICRSRPARHRCLARTPGRTGGLSLPGEHPGRRTGPASWPGRRSPDACRPEGIRCRSASRRGRRPAAGLRPSLRPRPLRATLLTSALCDGEGLPSLPCARVDIGPGASVSVPESPGVVGQGRRRRGFLSSGRLSGPCWQRARKL